MSRGPYIEELGTCDYSGKLEAYVELAPPTIIYLYGHSICGNSIFALGGILSVLFPFILVDSQSL